MREVAGSGERRTLLARKGAVVPSGKAAHKARVGSIGEGDRLFCGQHSADGRLFVTCRDERIAVLGTEDWAVAQSFSARDVGWTVVDLAMSPDQRSILYSSWSSKIHLIDCASGRQTAYSMPFPPSLRNFCTFSLKWAADSRSLLAGCSGGRVCILDAETRRPLFARASSRPEDREDVNAVAWADCSATVFFTGSDNSFVDVWDPRVSLQDPVQQLVGHLAGVTCIDSRGDGRYLISNSKDQSVKLWDLRKAHAWEGGRAVLVDSSWDYRYGTHPRHDALFSGRFRRVDDCSLMTYRGHTVHQTLIRAYFSPRHSTGQRFIYSGSANGCVCIWDVITGELRVLPGHQALVRDVSWHPYQPEIVSTSWDRKLFWWGAHSPPRTPHLIPQPRLPRSSRS